LGSVILWTFIRPALGLLIVPPHLNYANTPWILFIGGSKDQAAITALQEENKSLEQTIQQILSENRESVRIL
jgi:hypothetical protein